jgi:glutathione S-transferase
MSTPSVEPLLLFGAPVGLYTGKVRCFLRKHGIAYRECLPSDPVFQKELLPRLKRFINPVIRFPDGAVVQDTADILDVLEQRGLAREPALPATPRQRMVALIFDLYGGEGLIRPAMHYRWNFLDTNERFLRHEFGLSFRTGRAPPEVIAQRLDAFMRHLAGHLPNLGITAQTAAAVEASYEDLLDKLDTHFRSHPYALGGRPTLADYGLIAPLYAHLARDPYPATLMKQRAPSLYRWTERMNAPDADTPEFPRTPYALPDDDTVPETLLPLLRQVAAEFLPELCMNIAAIDAWLARQPASQTEGRVAERGPIRGSFELRGQPLETVVAPYTLYKLQRITDAWAALDDDARERVRALLEPCGLLPLLTLHASRRIERRDFLEVWGAATDTAGP